MSKLRQQDVKTFKQLEKFAAPLQDWTRGTRSQEFRNVESRQRVLKLFTTYCIARTTQKKKEDLNAAQSV